MNLQYEFLPKWVLEVGYVGSHGIHQAQNLHLLNEPGLASPGNPINGITTNTTSNASLRVPYLGFGPGGMQYFDTIGDIKFNSLQVTVRKQLSYGLTFQAAYTWSRAFADFVGPGGSNSGDPNNLAQQYGHEYAIPAATAGDQLQLRHSHGQHEGRGERRFSADGACRALRRFRTDSR